MTSLSPQRPAGADRNPAAGGGGGTGSETAGAGDDADADAEAYEHAHVHSVYDAIAPHFSATRHKPWPLVADFVRARVAAGAVGLDVGCGNGKYLDDAAATGAVMLACDRSAALVALARSKRSSSERAPARAEGPRRMGEAGAQGRGQGQGRQGQGQGQGQAHQQEHDGGERVVDVLLADALGLPFRRRCADFAICIAVVHHLATRPRRQEAIAQLLGCLSRDGQALIYVWALEQTASRRGWGEGGQQDLLVPWVTTGAGGGGKGGKDRQGAARIGAAAASAAPAPAPAGAPAPAPAAAAAAAPARAAPTGGAAGAAPAAQAPAQAPAQGARNKKKEKSGEDEDEPGGSGGDCSARGTGQAQTFQRYYHLYRQGELEEDVVAAGGEVISSGYERDNWWAVARERREAP